MICSEVFWHLSITGEEWTDWLYFHKWSGVSVQAGTWGVALLETAWPSETEDWLEGSPAEISGASSKPDHDPLSIVLWSLNGEITNRSKPDDFSHRALTCCPWFPLLSVSRVSSPFSSCWRGKACGNTSLWIPMPYSGENSSLNNTK